MKVTATDYRLRVDYRLPGKFYNAGDSDKGPFNNDKQSSYPFDSKDVEIGETFEVTGELVRVVEYRPTPANDTPSFN